MIRRLPRLLALMAALSLLIFGVHAQPLPIPPAGQESETPVHALTLNVDTGGQVTVAGYATAAVRGELVSQPLERFNETAQAGSDRDYDLATVQLMDDRSGAVVYQTTVMVSRWIRGEFTPDPNNTADNTIDGHFLPWENRSFAVKVPVIAGANRLAVSLPGSTRDSGIIDLMAVAEHFGLRDTRSETTLIPLAGYNNGASSNRVDIVILGDGYTAAQQADFEADAIAMANGLFSVAPFSTYEKYFNVVGIFAPSNQSGIDQPVCADTTLPMSGQYKDTRYDSTYCYNGIARLMVATDTAALYNDANAAYPDWDEIFLVANDVVYGGSGGAIAALARNNVAGQPISNTALEILHHEVGHSLIRLDDEYATPEIYPPCSDKGRSGIMIRCRPNVTDQTSRPLIKWSRWISPSTPIPTTGALNASIAGLWLGAHYSPTTYYRSCFDCVMRTLGKPFGPVASEQLPTVLYLGGWEGQGSYWGSGLGTGTGIDIIEPGTISPDPAAGVVNIAGGAAATFGFEVLSPAGGANTRVVWKVNNILVQDQLYSHGNTAAFTFTPFSAGTYTISAEVSEIAGVLHSLQTAASKSTRTWTASAAGYNGIGTELIANGSFETPAASAANKPDGWTLTNATKFKRKCDVTALFSAYEGSCALVVQGINGVTAVAKQVTAPVGDSGDAFRFSGQFNSVNLTGTFVTVVKFKFADGTTQKLNLNPFAVDPSKTEGYVRHEASLMLGLNAPNVNKIAVQLKFAGAGGKVYVDALSLLHYDEYLTSPPLPDARGQIIPPPLPPDTFRGQN